MSFWTGLSPFKSSPGGAEQPKAEAAVADDRRRPDSTPDDSVASDTVDFGSPRSVSSDMTSSRPGSVTASPFKPTTTTLATSRVSSNGHADAVPTVLMQPLFPELDGASPLAFSLVTGRGRVLSSRVLDRRAGMRGGTLDWDIETMRTEGRAPIAPAIRAGCIYPKPLVQTDSSIMHQIHEVDARWDPPRCDRAFGRLVGAAVGAMEEG